VRKLIEKLKKPLANQSQYGKIKIRFEQNPIVDLGTPKSALPKNNVI